MKVNYKDRDMYISYTTYEDEEWGWESPVRGVFVMDPDLYAGIIDGLWVEVVEDWQVRRFEDTLLYPVPDNLKDRLVKVYRESLGPNDGNEWELEALLGAIKN